MFICHTSVRARVCIGGGGGVCASVSMCVCERVKEKERDAVDILLCVNSVDKMLNICLNLNRFGSAIWSIEDVCFASLGHRPNK